MLETDLIDTAIKDENAFRQLVTKYYASMRVVACAIIGDSLADEVVQEAWLSIFKSLDKFEKRSSFKTWIITITSHEAFNRLRTEKRTVSLEDIGPDKLSMNARFNEDGMWRSPPNSWPEETPEALLSNKELMDCIHKQMAKLSEQQRTALSLKNLNGHSLKDICNILQVSPSNVRILIHRARSRLFQHIDRFQETGKC